MFVMNDGEDEYEQWLAGYTQFVEEAPRHAAIAVAKIAVRSRLKRARRFLKRLTPIVKFEVVEVDSLEKAEEVGTCLVTEEDSLPGSGMCGVDVLVGSP